MPREQEVFPLRIPVVLMRGGTSKCAFFAAADLPADPATRSAVLLRAFGSPDPRQIDGLGGATSTTSKAIIVAPPSRPDADLDYTFAQVAVAAPVVDYGGNCGNCSSAVGPYAVDQGLVPAPAGGGILPVRLHNTNTGKIIEAEVPVRGGRFDPEGDYEIAGVPGRGARIRMWFHDPGGAVTGRLLPTGQTTEECAGVEVSIVDAANPVVFVRAADVGLQGDELPARVDGDPALLQRLERIRGEAAVRCGLATAPAEAAATTPGIPKLAIVAPPRAYHDIFGRPVDAGRMQMSCRIMSMGRLHPAYALTGAICTGVAAFLPGTLVAQTRQGEGPEVVFGHPSGVMDVAAELRQGAAARAAASRTARRIWEGWVHVPAGAGLD